MSFSIKQTNKFLKNQSLKEINTDEKINYINLLSEENKFNTDLLIEINNRDKYKTISLPVPTHGSEKGLSIRNAKNTFADYL
jgi:hypothetical protein